MNVSAKDRTEPANLLEQLVKKEAQFNEGVEIMKGKIKDPIWKDWSKMQYIHRTSDDRVIDIHYWQHKQTKVKAGFKFKNLPW